MVHVAPTNFFPRVLRCLSNGHIICVKNSEDLHEDISRAMYSTRLSHFLHGILKGLILSMYIVKKIFKVTISTIKEKCPKDTAIVRAFCEEEGIPVFLIFIYL